MDFLTIGIICFVSTFFLFLMVSVYSLLRTLPYPHIEELEEESTYTDASLKKKFKFPSIKDPPSCSLSVIVPAFNEEKRLPPMLEESITYLEAKQAESQFTYEILIVDDGSTDRTSQVGLEYSKKYGSDKIRVLTLIKNRGKGGAVRLGMLRARGELLLFADADGATRFSDYQKVESAMLNLCKGSKEKSENLGIVCGSRAHLEEESIATRSFFRTLLMYGFHFMVWFFTVRNVKDTQCGFKLLTRRTARIIFRSLHVERWAFDVEMLYLAQTLGIPIEEVAVFWTEIEGSKVTPVISWIQMGMDLVIIWLRYNIGVWKIKGDFTK